METFKVTLSYTSDELMTERIENDYLSGDLLLSSNDNKVVFVTSEQEVLLFEDCDTIISTNEYIKIINKTGVWNFDILFESED